ncbi:hypothetical protein [Streptomyces sp. NPDC047130]|uniref:hypothetical protein n=1 Tax=Streptomyces sp. NPDC047130 TaxID=3155261 RepID=UPI0033D73E2F
MDLRAELMPPSVSEERLDELCREIVRIADLVLRGAEGAEREIEAFNARTGHGYVALDFAGYGGRREPAEFALEAGRPAWPQVEGITVDELVEVVSRVLAGDPESDYYLLLLRANVSHPRVGDPVFGPSAGLRGGSARQIVGELLGYQPIAL